MGIKDKGLSVVDKNYAFQALAHIFLTWQLSGIRSIINYDKADTIRDFSYTSTKMAAAVAMKSFYSHPSEPPSRYEVASSGFVSHPSSLHGLISQTDTRWACESQNNSIQNQSKPNRLSLPSIREALRPSTEYEPTVSTSLSSSHKKLGSQTPTIPRNYPPSEPVHFGQNVHPTPSQPVIPQLNSYSWPLEPIKLSIPETIKNSSAPTSVSGKSYNPRIEAARYDLENKGCDRPPSNHSHQSSNPSNFDPARTIPITPSSCQTNSIPKPSQLPRLESQEPSESWKKIMDEDKPDSALRFRGGIKRNLDVWDFENNLAEINISSSALQEWSAHYNAIAQDKKCPMSVLSERMPSIDSIKNIRKHQQKIYNCLEQLTRIINEVHQQSSRGTVDQHSQDPSIRSGDKEEEPIVSYVIEESKEHGNTSEAKKRRGRAAPPGRCHSCNRAETPEWRRGPDGARTLCNACGLHYAKLTRKNTINKTYQSNSSIRPKSLDTSPRSL